MQALRRFTLALAATAGLAAGLGASALAADDPPAFGRHVAMCAQMSLGQRDNPPVVACSHDGMTMTFANFGEMVQHMRAMQG